MPSRPQSAKPIGGSSPTSPMIYRINSARRSIPTHRHLINEVQKQSQQKTSRPQSARLRNSVDLSKSNFVTHEDQSISTSSYTRPQSASSYSKLGIETTVSGESIDLHSRNGIVSSSRASNNQSPIYHQHLSSDSRKRKMHSEALGNNKKRISFQGFEVKRSTTSLAVNRPASARPHYNEADKAMRRPQSATGAPLRQSSPSFGGYGNVLRRSSGSKIMFTDPVSWTKTSRERESLPMIELSLAENLKELSTRTLISKRELMENYIRVYDIAFERVLESIENSKVHGILSRIKTAYQRIWDLCTTIEEPSHSDQNSSMYNESELSRYSPMPSSLPFSAETITNESEKDSSSSESSCSDSSSVNSSDSNSNSQEGKLRKKILKLKKKLKESRKKNGIKSKIDLNKKKSTSESKELIKLKNRNKELEVMLKKHSQMLEYYNKKYFEEEHNQKVIDSISDNQLLQFRMKQIELEVDTEVFDLSIDVKGSFIDQSPKVKHSPRSSLSPRSPRSPRFFSAAHSPKSPRAPRNLSSPRKDKDVSSSQDSVLKEGFARRSMSLKQELEEARNRVFDLEKEIQTLENEDFFQNLGLKEGDQISNETQELSLKDRVLQQSREAKGSSPSGTVVSRGYKSNLNYGRVVTPIDEDCKGKSRQLQL